MTLMPGIMIGELFPLSSDDKEAKLKGRKEERKIEGLITNSIQKYIPCLMDGRAAEGSLRIQ